MLRAAELPRHAVTGDKRPTFGAAGTMAAGYTGQEFLAGLSSLVSRRAGS